MDDNWELSNFLIWLDSPFPEYTQWWAYINASTVIKILNTKEPKILFERLNKTYYINQRKSQKPNFLDRSLIKIGQQSLNNRISSILIGMMLAEWD